MLVAEIEDPLLGNEHILEDDQLVGFLALVVERMVEGIGARVGQHFAADQLDAV
ncbi:hypothetical protein D3C71_1250500 [compost metagenome]